MPFRFLIPFLFLFLFPFVLWFLFVSTHCDILGGYGLQYKEAFCCHYSQSRRPRDNKVKSNVEPHIFLLTV